VPGERRLPLRGYPGGADRFGNHVNAQFQLDTFGECLLLFAAARHDRLDTGHWPAVEQAIAAIERRPGDPDAGVWELDDRRWAHSRLTCVARLRAIAALAPAAALTRCSAPADRIAAGVDADCLHPSGRRQRAPGDPRVDAALLMPAIRRALPAADLGSRAALRAVATELGREGYVTGSGSTAGNSGRLRVLSCCAGSRWRWPLTSRVTTWKPCAGSNATVPRAGLPGRPSLPRQEDERARGAGYALLCRTAPPDTAGDRNPGPPPR
jgi:GH15 family glucan-1,4-alpha-glucosidase